MGILAPGNDKMPAAPKTRAERALGEVFRPCDSCGHSHDNHPIGRALYQVETSAGSLYLCGNHFRKHSGHIFERGYPVQELRRVAK